ncbi:MAG: ImmA/IrrE family metallo-endopeptidase [Chloroflexi bacterium]|nr:ImmA/IrrE family metallo-endopeptidase [Chloroflexota bacterium]
MNRIGVQPGLLRWARERSGRSVEYLVGRFPKLNSWERGDVLPTFRQLEEFAKATYTPIGYLFLQEPPAEELPVTDFRTMGDAEIGRPSPDLLDTLYLCQQRQDWYRDEARTAGLPPLDFVGSLDTTIDVVSAGAHLRNALGFDAEQRRRLATWTEALRQFIDQADHLGILVMVSGVVGSNTHRQLNPEEFRGFALADPLAPLIFINGADTKAAQMFTMAHEIAHLWLGESGVSNTEAVSSPSHAVERWCNQVAAELLVPADLVREEFDAGSELTAEANRLARRFKVSTLVVLRRVYDTGGVDRDAFWSAYREETVRLRNITRGSGGNQIRNVGVRVSKLLARTLIVSTLEGRTSYAEAFRLLGIKKVSTFESVAANLGVGV